jgi:peptide/nickel transport system permease protein
VIHGNFGYSLFYNDDVINVVKKPLERTIILGLISLAISFVVGIVLGVLSAVYRGKWVDDLISVIANIGIAAPQFWIGIILIYVLAMHGGFFPIEGYTDPYVNFGEFSRDIFLPVSTLAIPSVASIVRQTRSAVLETIGQDYVRTARAKGLKNKTILVKHVLKNAMIPVITLLGLRVRYVFGGSIIVEQIFNINGMGRVMAKSITMKDTNMAQCCILIIGIVVIVSTLVVDILYGVLDPRIRDKKGE